jgi:hypothetical protein
MHMSFNHEMRLREKKQKALKFEWGCQISATNRTENLQKDVPLLLPAASSASQQKKEADCGSSPSSPLPAPHSQRNGQRREAKGEA